MAHQEIKTQLKSYYKNIIIGGGIVGAGILRDLALHKEDALLIDKYDFSSQTSGGSSKMLHGGIRYLENFDFFLVFEALREKKLWLKLASHITEEREFILPVYKDSKWPLFFMRIGLFIYNLLSLFRNKPFRILNKKQTCSELPGLNSKNLKGAGVYSDGVIDDSKLVFDLIFDSIHHGANALNYHEIISYKKDDNKQKYLIEVVNTLTKERTKITCKNLIFAVGPFTDQLMHKLQIPWNNIILPSKGSHLWLKASSLEIQNPLVIQTKDQRVIFVVPQRNAILVGTTEVPLNDKDVFENISPSQAEIDYLLECVNQYFPNAKLTTKSILSTYAAVRPLIKSGSSAKKTSRTHKIYKPQKNVFIIAGGKYTTFRVMAQDLCKKIIKDYNPKMSKKPFSNKSLLASIHKQEINEELIKRIIKEEQVHSMEDLLLRRLSLYSEEQYKDPNLLKSLLEGKV